MSAQTGTAYATPPPPKHPLDYLRFAWHRLLHDPNPLWIRELKQSARLVRTPVILCVFAMLTTLLIASVGGLVSLSESPATTGYILFQTFFSIAYFIVTFIGPGVAANAIAAEREGRTWEAVTLTGLRPAVIARGKFLAAYTSIAMYVVMLAPVGALPFLFGGVTATETVVAFAFLFLIAGLAVAFGLAISSKMNSLRAALVVSLLCAVIVSLNVYGFLGVGLSYGAHSLWPGVPDGPPVWLPTAYARAPFDLTYLGLLVGLPIAAAALPAWLLYEVTVANLTSITDDRSTGLKRWYAVCTPVFAIATSIPILTMAPSDRMVMCLFALAAHFVFLMMGVYLFAGDSIGPSRRVVLHWERSGAGRLRRFFGPSIIKTSALELFVGMSTILIPTIAGLVAVPPKMVRGASSYEESGMILLMAAYVIGFFVFSVGFTAFLRSRTSTTLATRLILLAVHFLVAIGPWVVAAIAGVMSSGMDRSALVVAAPSPFYVFLAMDAIDRGKESILVTGSVFMSIVWCLFGLLFLGLARSRTARVIAQHNAALAESDRLLAAEDAAMAQAAAPEPSEEPAEPPATEPDAVAAT
jgi:ABC-type transport system involved in multi-copper enzyme maturation permease subunit